MCDLTNILAARQTTLPSTKKPESRTSPHAAILRSPHHNSTPKPSSSCIQLSPDIMEIYWNLRHRLHLNSDPRHKQQASNITVEMRSILVDWMIEVAEEYKLHLETLFLSVSYTDVCIQKLRIERSELQLLGVTCVLVAAKYEEIYAPQLSDLCYITDNSYTQSQIIAMERRVLECLEFSLTIPTTNTFMSIYLSAYFFDTEMLECATMLSKVTLVQGIATKDPPHIIAFSVIILVCVYVRRTSASLQQMVEDFDIEYSALHGCVRSLHDNFKSYDSVKFPAVCEHLTCHDYLQLARMTEHVELAEFVDHSSTGQPLHSELRSVSPRNADKELVA